MHFNPTEKEIDSHKSASDEILSLLSIMSRLRSAEGCPWDREQTWKSLRLYLLEETYEVLEAIDSGDTVSHVEELGDVLLQIVFQSEIAREAGIWDFKDVVSGICDKLICRHPHVFGDIKADDAEAAYKNWEKVKADEKKKSGRPRKCVIDGVPKTAPALLRAERIGEKASNSGFDWSHIRDVRKKLDEELAELDQAIAENNGNKIFDEFGDVLLTMTSLGRFLKIHSEDALREAVHRFSERFRALDSILKSEGGKASDMTEEKLENLWQKVKKKLAGNKINNE